VAERAFDGVITSPLCGRPPKPRTRGQTMLLDKGLGLSETGDLLEMAADYVDFIKFTFGTAALYPTELLRAKIALIRSYGVDVYPGGTFLEIALTQGALPSYLDRALALGFTCIEVSDGTIDIGREERRTAISQALALGFTVITEVGKKDPTEPFHLAEASDMINADLAAGASKVIVEARESGKGVGLFDPQGNLKADDLATLIHAVTDPDVLMWEAPLKSQQEDLILRLGSGVNLGNIPPAEVLALEALRCGFRGDTLRAALARQGGN
jgi:phosphosulfolactate synthase